MADDHKYCVILAGGYGTRLWPYSRRDNPKQFLDFFGTGMSLLQQTFERMRHIAPEDHIYVLTAQEYKDKVMEQLPSAPEQNILEEPLLRNTGPSVTWACLHVRARDSQANVIVVPSDQLVFNEFKFVDDANRGLDFVSSHEKLLTMGVVPTRPETAYGYIQVSDEVVDGQCKVKSFTEKPEESFAKFFVESGEFLWNTGIMLFNVNTFISEVRKIVPEMSQRIDDLSSHEISQKSEMDYIRQAYSFCPNFSVDRGILEKSENVFVMTCGFTWVDVGSWASFFEASPKDCDNNVLLGSKSFCYNASGNMVFTPHEKLVILEDLKDYLVVDADGVMVICPRSKADNMRRFLGDVQFKLGDEYM